MNTACCSTAARPDANVFADFQYAKLNRASVDAQASAGISLVTADGDKVTLNASSSLQASLQTYDYLGRTQGQTIGVDGEKFQLSTSSGFAVSVEGSLDKAELDDIKKLLNTLSAIGKDFFAGNTDNGLQHLAQLDDLDSIASFEASFNYSRQITAVAASQISSTTAAQTTESPGPTATAPTTGAPAADSFIDQLARAAEQLESDNKFEKIPKRFAQLFNKLAHQLPLDDHEEKLAARIHSEHSRRGHGHPKDELARSAS